MPPAWCARWQVGPLHGHRPSSRVGSTGSRSAAPHAKRRLPPQHSLLQATKGAKPRTSPNTKSGDYSRAIGGFDPHLQSSPVARHGTKPGHTLPHASPTCCRASSTQLHPSPSPSSLSAPSPHPSPSLSHARAIALDHGGRSTAGSARCASMRPSSDSDLDHTREVHGFPQTSPPHVHRSQTAASSTQRSVASLEATSPSHASLPLQIPDSPADIG